MSTYKGITVALMTPFHENGDIDWKTFENYVNWLCETGVHGLVPCGTTGEFLALTKEEQKKLIEINVKTSNKRAKVIAGASAVLPKEAIELSLQAEQCHCLSRPHRPL